MEANIKDAKILFDLANDPLLRSMSFSEKPIKWEEHLKWLSGRFESEKCSIYIGVDEADNKVGYIRFDMVSFDEAKISISIARDFRGKGYGSQLLNAGCKKIFEKSSVKKLWAIVKKENIISAKFFKKAGFLLESEKEIKGVVCFNYYLNKEQE